MRRRISSPALVGRREELAVADDLLMRAREGEASLLIVAGEAGVGKTRLVRELERRAADTGMLSLRGHCLALAGGEFPFAPLAGIFDTLAAREGSTVVSGLKPSTRALLDVLLGAPTPATAPAREPVAPAHAHAAMLELLRRVAEEQPTAIVIEDIHWADESTRDFLRSAARALEHERLAVAVTFRSDELASDHPARALVAELIRCDPVVHLTLERLTLEQTAEQLAAIAGEPVAGAAVSAVHTRAHGNPFLAEELWAAGASATIPATLGDALLARVRALSPEAQHVLRLLAVFGRPVGPELLVAADRRPEATLELARGALAAHILEPSAGGAQLTFRHALVREALYAELLPGEREALHNAVLSALEGSGGSAAELAYHLLAAGRRAEALGASIDAGLEDVRRAAYPEALTHFERALGLWDAVADDGSLRGLDRLDVRREAAEAARLTGEYDRAIEHCRTALEQIDLARDPQRAAGFFERLSRYESWDTERSLAALEQALELLGPEPSAERARALTGRALQLGMRGRWPEARASAEQALAVAVAIGERVEECSALTELGIALAFDGDPDAGEHRLRRALALAEEQAAPEEVARAYTNLAELERLRGRTGAALAAMRDGQAQAEAMGVGASWGAFMAVLSTDDLLQLGRWDELDSLLERTGDLSAGRAGAVVWPLVAGQLAMARGQLQPAAALLERARECALRGATPELLPHVGTALTELRLWQEDPPAARRHVEEACSLIGDHEDVLNTPPLLFAGVRVEAEIAARHARAGDRRAAQAARERAEALAQRLDALAAVRPPPKALALREQAHAELATPDRPDDAARGWAAAAASWTALADPYRAAYAQLRHAEALLALRGKRAEAAHALQRARRAAGDLGAALLTREIEALARRARLGMELAAPVAPEPEDAHGLTPREAEVLDLVADGLTNRQIGERLFITPKTAGLHVSHILAKLNVDSRVKAAAVAHHAHLEETRDAHDRPAPVRSADHARPPDA